MHIINAGNRVVNTYVYLAPTGYVMIDTGYERRLKSVEKALRRQNVVLSEIKYIFLTHAHDDHAGFLNELLTKYPQVRVIADEKAVPTLLKGQNSFSGGCSGRMAYGFCKLMGLFGKGKHLFPAIEERFLDRFILVTPLNTAEAENLLQGKIMFTPGHTVDSMSLSVGNIIFCGDAAMNGFPSVKRITIWVENKTDFENSWHTLLGVQADFIYPAHGKPFPKGDLKKYAAHIGKVKLYRLKSDGCDYVNQENHEGVETQAKR